VASIQGQLADALGRRGIDESAFGRGDAGSGSILSDVRRAGINGPVLTGAVAEVLGVPFCESLTGQAPSPEFVRRMPIGFARRHKILGVAGENGRVRVALADLASWQQLAVVARVLGRPVEPVFAPESAITSAINAAYQDASGGAQEVIEALDRDEVFEQVQRLGDSEDLLDVAARAPVIQLVNRMLFDAVRRRASDVHVQPHEDKLVIRFRIDGEMHPFFTPPKAVQEEVISRIKVMGRMNIAEKRLAQDGRATVAVGERIIDLRIATLPTSFGERAVIRLLDKSIRLYRLGELGMAEAALERFRGLIGTDHGIILVTGPTGSGKTTTLYAALQEIDAEQVNILTLEDPIEYRLAGISQTQVSERKGMTFATGLRHVLRQDPDVIMVGEIRDAETARMAIQSALTGHLVFSTLHTNDAASAITRLLDLGVEPYLAASSLMAVLAQRLVRRICPQCSQPYQPQESDWLRWGMDPAELAGWRLRRGCGCEHCLGTGYYDRVGIFELLVVDEGIRTEILKYSTVSAINRRAVEAGMQTLRQDGMDKVFAGTTTLEEVVRVTARVER